MVLHHSATDSGSVESIDAAHKQRLDAAGNPWKGIGYHFVIGNGNGMNDGEVQATFRWQDQLAGAHAGDANYNEFGIGICLIGNFEESPPTTAQLASLQRLLLRVRQEFGIKEQQILRHGDLKATACPGRLFPGAKIVQAQELPNHPRLTHMESDVSLVTGLVKEGNPRVGPEKSNPGTR